MKDLCIHQNNANKTYNSQALFYTWFFFFFALGYISFRLLNLFRFWRNANNLPYFVSEEIVLNLLILWYLWKLNLNLFFWFCFFFLWIIIFFITYEIMILFFAKLVFNLLPNGEYSNLWLYVIIMPRTSFRVNLHSIVCPNVKELLARKRHYIWSLSDGDALEPRIT